ncbi:hypothetical protein CC117_18785 [Parafrankia colletiae]|uniref:Uncharacterized protein n=1 Tax=Parafrankia colletiae TaxID=573497 RepID=A0A1S1QQI4_9ACTN|nr:hypothetical protein CC117_18785 [Parafrankia colletiae]
MPLAEDRHPAGHLGPDRADELFCTSVRPRSPRWEPDGGDAGVGEDRVERRGDLAGRSRTRNRKSAARLPRSTRRFRICRVVNDPSG